MIKRSPFPRVFAAACCLAMLAACAANPLQIAETPAQQAYAIERVYTDVVLAQAVELAAAQPNMRPGIQAVERRTTPVIDQLVDAIAAYEIERAKFAQGETTEARLVIVAENLESWLDQAQRALIELDAALE